MKTASYFIQYIEEKVTEHQFPVQPEHLYDPLRYFMTLGGKRMRPVLTLLAADMCNCEPDEAIHAAKAIEFFHNFSLIHDDIMDEAPTRRGKQTVHLKWNRDIAILSGDVLLVEAYELLANYSDERLIQLLRLFNKTAKEVCEGQQMDMDFESMPQVTKAQYIEMIRLKTSVLLGCAMQFGAIVGRASAQIQEELYQFGMEMGIGFQIQDDLLDLYADPDKFGKQVGGDILANKKTLLFLNALDLAGESNEVQNLMQMPADSLKIEKAQRLFKEIGAVEKTTADMNSYYEKAFKRLQGLENEGFDTTLIRQVSENLMVREI